MTSCDRTIKLNDAKCQQNKVSVIKTPRKVKKENIALNPYFAKLCQ